MPVRFTAKKNTRSRPPNGVPATAGIFDPSLDVPLLIPSTVVETAVATARQLLQAAFCAFLAAPLPTGENPAAIVDGIAPETVQQCAQDWSSLAKALFACAKPGAALQAGQIQYGALTVESVLDSSGRDLGMLVAGFPSEREGDSRNQLLCRTLAAYLGMVIESDARRAQKHEGYEALFEIGSRIQVEVKLDKVLSIIVQKARALVNAEVAWLGLVDEPGEHLYIRVTDGARTPNFRNMHLPVGTGIGGVALEQRRTVVVPDYISYLQNTPEFVWEAVTEEGIVSLICAPMLRESKMVGALYVGNRRQTQFTASDVSLLSTLATQASIAIENARLYRQQEDALCRLQDLNSLLEDKNRLLEQSSAVHQELTAAVLSGASIAEVGARLAKLIGKRVAVQQEISPPLFAEYLPPSEGEERSSTQGVFPVDEPFVSVPIIAGSEELGRVLVLGVTSLTDIDQRAMEHGSTVLALELIKQRATRDVEWRLQGELLEALLEAHGELPEALKRRAERLGFNIEQPHCILLVQADRNGDELQRGDLMATARMAVREQGPLLGLRRGERVILAIRVQSGKQASGFARSIQEAFRRFRHATVSIGISGCTGIGRDLATAHQEALVCLQFARKMGTVEAVLGYEDLGPLRFLLDAPDVQYAIEFVRQQLDPLAVYDSTHRAALMQTIRAYVEAEGHHPTAARRCFIHVSTLKYRMSRAAEILGVPLTDPELKFNLQLAFRLLDFLQAMGTDVFQQV